MLKTGAGDMNIFRQVEQIQIADIQVQALWYFGLQGIGNLNISLKIPLQISSLQNLANNQP